MFLGFKVIAVMMTVSLHQLAQQGHKALHQQKATLQVAPPQQEQLQLKLVLQNALCICLAIRKQHLILSWNTSVQKLHQLFTTINNVMYNQMGLLTVETLSLVMLQVLQ